MTSPTTSDELVTVDQAAVLTGRSTKTIRRYLPTDNNEKTSKGLLTGARQEGVGTNAPWVIPVSDLVLLGWLAASSATGPIGSADARDVLSRQREDKELTRLREQLAMYQAADRMKQQLLQEKESELARVRKDFERLHKTLDLALTAPRFAAAAA